MITTNKVYYLSCGRWLNRSQFIYYFEHKVLGTIRKFSLIKKEDKIAVAFSGGKDSLTLLYVLSKLCKERNQEIVALAIEEGIGDYRTKLLEEGKKSCKKLGIELKIFNFKNQWNYIAA